MQEWARLLRVAIAREKRIEDLCTRVAALEHRILVLAFAGASGGGDAVVSQAGNSLFDSGDIAM
jgi:hypothetical protein